MKEVILTPEGYKKLQAEIEYLSNEKRRDGWLRDLPVNAARASEKGAKILRDR